MLYTGNYHNIVNQLYLDFKTGDGGGRRGSNNNAKDKRASPDAGINKSVFRVSVSRKMGLSGQFGLNN